MKTTPIPNADAVAHQNNLGKGGRNIPPRLLPPDLIDATTTMCEQKASGLSPERKRLVGAMQKNPYSRIENLAVANGIPVFGPNTRLIAETKLGSADGARPEGNLADFVLKREHVELFRQLDEIGSGEILTLEVRGGLPFRIIREVGL